MSQFFVGKIRIEANDLPNQDVQRQEILRCKVHRNEMIFWLSKDRRTIIGLLKSSFSE